MTIKNHIPPARFTGRNAFREMGEHIRKADAKRVDGLRKTSAARQANRNRVK